MASGVLVWEPRHSNEVEALSGNAPRRRSSPRTHDLPGRAMLVQRDRGIASSPVACSRGRSTFQRSFLVLQTPLLAQRQDMRGPEKARPRVAASSVWAPGFQILLRALYPPSTGIVLTLSRVSERVIPESRPGAVTTSTCTSSSSHSRTR